MDAAWCAGDTVRREGRRRTLSRLVRRAREEDPLHVRQQVQRRLLVRGRSAVVELRRRVRRAAAALWMRSARRQRRVRRATARSRPEGQLHHRSSTRRLRRPVGGLLRATLASAWRPRAEGCDPWAAGERGPARLRRARGRRAEGPLSWGLSETPRPGLQIFEEARRQRIAGFSLRALHVGCPWLVGPRWRYVLWHACVVWLSWPLASRALGCNQAFCLQHGVAIITVCSAWPR